MNKVRGSRSQRGVALLVVLWVLAILMVTVLSFSFLTRTQTQATVFFRDSAERKLIAEAGIQRAVMELFYRRQNADNTVILPGTEGWKVDGTVYRGMVGPGSYAVSIIGETGKIDINRAKDVLFKKLLLNFGLSDELSDTIVDSVMDWRGASGLERLHGAGNDYYQSLPVPYKVKNAPFDTVEEILLVKGVTLDILYGDGNRKGIIDCLTVNAGGETINLNYAPREVLMAIPGMSASTADSIIQYRADQTIKNAQEVLSGDYQIMMPFINVNEGNIFTIESVGYTGDEKNGYPVRATVILDSDNAYRYLYYKSPAYKVLQRNG
ncbi:MAG: general secretion pathway protein GspK [Nitrospirae bacterium]|nr:general secretion pathway protein GspK [Nitrospirota bacterium]